MIWHLDKVSRYESYGIRTQHADFGMVGNTVGSLLSKSGVGWVNAGPGTRSELNWDTRSENSLRNCKATAARDQASISSSNGLCVRLILFESAERRHYLREYKPEGRPHSQTKAVPLRSWPQLRRPYH